MRSILRISLGNANRPFAVHAAAAPSMTHVKEVSMGKVFAGRIVHAAAPFAP
jgi:hypothetical protein